MYNYSGLFLSIYSLFLLTPSGASADRMMMQQNNPHFHPPMMHRHMMPATPPMQMHIEQHHQKQMQHRFDHNEFHYHHGKTHFERFHQFYYPWGLAYPYSYYYSTPVPQEEPIIIEEEDKSTAPLPTVEPKTIKILPNGDVLEQRPSYEDDDMD